MDGSVVQISEPTWDGCERRDVVLSHGQDFALQALGYREGHQGELQEALLVYEIIMGPSLRET